MCIPAHRTKVRTSYYLRVSVYVIDFEVKLHIGIYERSGMKRSHHWGSAVFPLQFPVSVIGFRNVSRSLLIFVSSHNYVSASFCRSEEDRISSHVSELLKAIFDW